MCLGCFLRCFIIHGYHLLLSRDGVVVKDVVIILSVVTRRVIDIPGKILPAAELMFVD